MKIPHKHINRFLRAIEEKKSKNHFEGIRECQQQKGMSRDLEVSLSAGFAESSETDDGSWYQYDLIQCFLPVCLHPFRIRVYLDF